MLIFNKLSITVSIFFIFRHLNIHLIKDLQRNFNHSHLLVLGFNKTPLYKCVSLFWFYAIKSLELVGVDWKALSFVKLFR